MNPKTIILGTTLVINVLINGIGVEPASCSLPPPEHLNAKAVSESEIDLEWSAAQSSPDNEIIYKIFRNGEEIAETYAVTYSDFDLNPATIYEYAVMAMDQTGQISNESMHVIVNTINTDTSPIIIEERLEAVKETVEATVSQALNKADTSSRAKTTDQTPSPEDTTKILPASTPEELPEQPSPILISPPPNRTNIEIKSP